MVFAGSLEAIASELSVRSACARLGAARALFIASVCLMHGCAHGEATRVAAPPRAASQVALAQPLPRTPQPEQPDSIESFMAEHSMITTWARDAVINGDLEELRVLMQGLGAYRYDSVKVGSWLPFMAELQRTANQTAEATSLELAAKGMATMGRVCGECHRATRGGPQLRVTQPKMDATTDPLARRMQKHVWAADQLWQGLIAPSDAAWNAGARALAQIPTDSDLDVPLSYRQALLDIRALGSTADRVSSSAERADLYGVLLAKCADCHEHRLDSL